MATRPSHRFVTRLLRQQPCLRRQFHVSRSLNVQVGDAVPASPVVLMEGSPGNKVDLAKEVGTGPALIIGVPAAFSKKLFSSVFVAVLDV